MASPPKHDREVRRIADELQSHGIFMLRAEDGLQAAEHAARHGFISAQGLEEVRRELQREAEGPEPAPSA